MLFHWSTVVLLAREGGTQSAAGAAKLLAHDIGARSAMEPMKRISRLNAGFVQFLDIGNAAHSCRGDETFFFSLLLVSCKNFLLPSYLEYMTT